jgi:hypothetical protein
MLKGLELAKINAQSTYIKGNVSGSKKNGNNKSNFLGGNFLEKFF